MPAKRLLWVVVLLMAACALAKDRPRFKSVEVKHFSQVEGVELSPQFADFLYAELKTELKKSRKVAWPKRSSSVLALDAAACAHRSTFNAAAIRPTCCRKNSRSKLPVA